jgi:hypothetical protein
MREFHSASASGSIILHENRYRTNILIVSHWGPLSNPAKCKTITKVGIINVISFSVKHNARVCMYLSYF